MNNIEVTIKSDEIDKNEECRGVIATLFLPDKKTTASVALGRMRDKDFMLHFYNLVKTSRNQIAPATILMILELVGIAGDRDIDVDFDEAYEMALSHVSEVISHSLTQEPTGGE